MVARGHEGVGTLGSRLPPERARSQRGADRTPAEQRGGSRRPTRSTVEQRAQRDHCGAERRRRPDDGQRIGQHVRLDGDTAEHQQHQEQQ